MYSLLSNPPLIDIQVKPVCLVSVLYPIGNAMYWMYHFIENNHRVGVNFKNYRHIFGYTWEYLNKLLCSIFFAHLDLMSVLLLKKKTFKLF